MQLEQTQQWQQHRKQKQKPTTQVKYDKYYVNGKYNVNDYDEPKIQM